MATKKQKRERGIAKREAFEAEQRERNQHFLKIAQAERAEQRRKAEQERKDRAIAKSKRLARAHEAAKMSKPGKAKTVVERAGGKNNRRQKLKKQQKIQRVEAKEAS